MRTLETILALALISLLAASCGAQDDAKAPAEKPKADAAPAYDPAKDPNAIGVEEAVMELKVGERVLAPAVPGVFRAKVVVVKAGDGSAESLFKRAEAKTLAAKPANASRADGKLTVRGDYTDGTLRVPFVWTIDGESAKPAVLVDASADFRALVDEFAVAEHSLDLPLAVAESPHDRLLAFGGATRVEMFRMDMNDEDRRAQNISDNRGYRPYWDIGGVRQLATGYQVWQANHADTRAYPVEEGEGAPGWADFSSPDAGLTVWIDEPQKSAPWSIVIDARKGTLVISPRPPEAMPIAGKDMGRAALRFRLIPHETSWPATYPCELPLERYQQLMDYLKSKNMMGYLGSNLGLQDADLIIRKARVQPSVVLRIFYRADAWRMGAICKDLLGRDVGRNQPLDEWEKINAEILGVLREKGVPGAK